MNKATRRPRVFTIGHSDRSLEELLAILESASIKLVADVRSNPSSARFPWFEKSALASELEGRGLVYRWFRGLGGRRPDLPGASRHDALDDAGMRNYAEAMNGAELTRAAEDLLGLAASTSVTVLCAERDPRHCHRFLLADKLHFMGARVVHVLGVDEAEDHHVHPDIVEEDGALVYRKRQLSLIGEDDPTIVS
jgi:uncharacterized protein (DUF488 family)